MGTYDYNVFTQEKTNIYNTPGSIPYFNLTGIGNDANYVNINYRKIETDWHYSDDHSIWASVWWKYTYVQFFNMNLVDNPNNTTLTAVLNQDHETNGGNYHYREWNKGSLSTFMDAKYITWSCGNRVWTCSRGYSHYCDHDTTIYKNVPVGSHSNVTLRSNESTYKTCEHLPGDKQGECVSSSYTYYATSTDSLYGHDQTDTIFSLRENGKIIYGNYGNDFYMSNRSYSGYSIRSPQLFTYITISVNFSKEKIRSLLDWRPKNASQGPTIAPYYVFNRVPFRKLNLSEDPGDLLVGINHGGGKPMPSVNRDGDKYQVTLTIHYEIRDPSNPGEYKSFSVSRNILCISRPSHSQFVYPNVVSDNNVDIDNSWGEKEGLITTFSLIPNMSPYVVQ